jgi:hypothetical protein
MIPLNATYKTDDSFFIVLAPQESCYSSWPVQRWLLQTDSAKFRLIKDEEVDADRLTLEQVQDIYPGIATIGVTINPWARIVQKFWALSRLSKAGKELANTLFPSVDLTDFESVVNTGLKDPTIMQNELVQNQYVHIFFPQLKWLSQDSPTGKKYCDFVIRGEHAQKDVKPLADYFMIDPKKTDSIDFNQPLVDYKPYYSSKTKKIVATYFAEDIDYFKYKF